jgi:Holliday junction resolvasome RuvABC endonuclease subunit
MTSSDPNRCYLGLDLSSTRIGYAVLRGDDLASGQLAFKGSLASKLHYYRRWLHDMIERHRPAAIAVEDVFAGGDATPTSYGPLYCLKGVTLEATSTYRGDLGFVHPSTWKSKICRRKITTADKKAGLVVQILNSKGWYVTGIDEADAVAVALCRRLILQGISDDLSDLLNSPRVPRARLRPRV